MTQNETWKSVPGYEGYYEVSSIGNVRSVTRFVKTTIRHTNQRRVVGRTLKMVMTHIGYYRVSLAKDGETNNFDVHRLVASAFIPNVDMKKAVNHINGIKTDNRVENLEWVTYQENHWHARDKGLLRQIGQHQNKRLICEETGIVFENSVRAAEWLLAHDAKRTTQTQATPIARCIRACASGRTPRAFGYHWADVGDEGSTTSRKAYTQASGNGRHPSDWVKI